MNRPIVNGMGLLLIRGIVGIVLMMHGSQKLFGAFGGPGLEGFAGFLESIAVPLPMVSAILAACAEFFGGLALVLGLLTRIVAIPVAFTMFVAIVKVHNEAFFIKESGMEYALTLGLVVVGLALTGPGCLSIDHLIFGRRTSTSEGAVQG
ncbi:Putative oxidoreductase MhqP [Maioricimonas rarisocia]|uniref:Oxidoreductase MhqP n=1 Tax=Maioricimonas rarisocia TaxID=2528026 RepID=A0A517Z803_9PLAN|nr:DoxX family protein [Maioricimonas rarisocia]QDU38603.1 Putative oxidoreductase MhqP [Maioricimonas rarisocia]